MATFSTKQPTATYEELDEDDNLECKLNSLREPCSPQTFSGKEALAIISCALSFAVATVVVFEPRVAVYWGQNRQFIWIGLCLTLMGWCAQLLLRRIFLLFSLNSQTSTLQSIDAILRSDPLTSQANLRIRVLLVLMLALGPALSATYKSLGGESRYSESNLVGQFGLSSPLGNNNIGYGLSQFVNATLPWFTNPGFPNRVYGFNMHVATDNMSAMLDAPTADYIASLQNSLKPLQSKTITATVSATVCEWNAQLDKSVDYFKTLMREPSPNTSSPTSAKTWTQLSTIHIAMLMPVESDNTNVVVARWDDSLNESFGSHLWQYTLSRQNYTGSWRVSQNSVELVNATPLYQRVDDHCLLKSNWLAMPDLYVRMFAEFDWRYHPTKSDFYHKWVKNDATLLASMVWSRLVALAPITVIGLTPNPRCDPEGLPELIYDSNVVLETVAVAVKPGWEILLVLALYPMLLLISLVLRLVVWPRPPIGEGFGLISLLASVERSSLALLEGAGLSGKLGRPVFVGFSVIGYNRKTDATKTGKITSSFKTRKIKSRTLNKETEYR